MYTRIFLHVAFMESKLLLNFISLNEQNLEIFIKKIRDPSSNFVEMNNIINV